MQIHIESFAVELPGPKRVGTAGLGHSHCSWQHHFGPSCLGWVWELFKSLIFVGSMELEEGLKTQQLKTMFQTTPGCVLRPNNLDC